MATTTNEGSIAKTRQSAVAEKKPKGMKDLVNDMMPAITAALPSVITPERFTRMTLSALSSNKQLQACTPASFLGAMMTAAQLGVEPNTPLGQAYLIPYKNKGVMECQFQLGYKGLIDLAYRSGEVKTIQAHTVYENDKFEFELGLEPKLTHIPAYGDRGDPVYFYAVWRGKDDAFGFEVMSKNDVDAHAKKYSQSYGSNYSPWKTSYEEMAKKTVLKRCLKYAPLKSDFIRGVAADETVKHVDDSNLADVLDMNNEMDYVEVDPNTGEVLNDVPVEPQQEAQAV